MTRRQKGTGGVREKRRGVWELKFDTGVDRVTGKRQTRYRTVKGNRRAAETELRRLLCQIDTGEFVQPAKITVGHLLDRWLNHTRSQVAPKTHERYGQLVANNIGPVLGHHKLDSLRTIDIDGAWANLLEDGRKDGKGGLSPQTVKHCHRVLRQALAQAVRWQMIARNPADEVEPPRVARKEITVLDAVQTATLIEATRGTEFYVPTLIAVTTGLRRGETLALRWKHIELEAGVLAVVESVEQTKAGIRFKEPKGKRARQVVMTALLVAELRQHRLRQAQDLLKLGIRQTEDTLVCCRADGEIMNPEDLSRRFPEIVLRAGLPRLTFHSLRHSHATQMLVAGIHPKVAQERLGHSSIQVTMDRYSHLVPGLQEEAAEKVDSAIQAALKSGSRTA
ncbi:MAG TPA: tyrosine-type recombinase/integrase [Alphaproteobacteria bacterium]|jgi:integrase|nr:tyrosine-type recombinase/integrase [Alphaproteobacteria bacterium]